MLMSQWFAFFAVFSVVQIRGSQGRSGVEKSLTGLSLIILTLY
ncbi:hypothetical protein SAMN04487964_10630 [Marinobacterium sediminicola]|uniref:Uncharacterized protein n=1 Tax=Marinobacterium sediminicola TaxID=518898 RepID=A0ABY1S040_9GAMM|nr:hypothetical protein SAMN04487964_10630 [Marinobacterium sediminicola]